MPKNIIQTERDRNTYIPTSVESAMHQQVNNYLPAHLKTYVNTNNSGYVSAGMQKTITKELNQHLPPHLQQYTDAYVQQNIVSPVLKKDNAHSLPMRNKPPIPDKLRLDHSVPVLAQHNVETKNLPKAANNLFAADRGQLPSSTPDNNFDFIFNPNANSPGNSKFSFSGFSPLIKKLAVVVAIAFIITISIVILSSLLKGKSNTPAFISVAQDQQVLLNTINQASTKQNLTSKNQNFIPTANLALTSSQKQLLSYMKTNHMKFSQKKLLLKINPSVDQQLSTAVISGNYDQVFDQILTSQINTYRSDILIAYKLTKGKIGQGLLNSFFYQAYLMKNELSSSS